MEVESKRLFVGGLHPEISADDLKNRFKSFGVVKAVDIKVRKDAEGNAVNTFAYLDTDMTEKDLKKCVQTYNKTKWKGHVLQIQIAKESFLQRLKKEQKIKDTPTETPVKNIEEPEENKHQVMKDLVVKGPPGTAIEGKEGWVVGKYGRAVPVVKMKGKDRRKILTLDPSKVTHQIKAMDRGKVQEKDDVPVTELTWELQGTDSEISKKRKGEFPNFTPKKKKISKIVHTSESETKAPEPKLNGFHEETSEFEVVSAYSKPKNKSRLSAKAMEYDSDSSAGSADTDEIIAVKKGATKSNQQGKNKEEKLMKNGPLKGKLSKDNERKISLTKSDSAITPRKKQKQNSTNVTSNPKHADDTPETAKKAVNSPITQSSLKVYHSDTESEDEKPMFTVLPKSKFAKAQPLLVGKSSVSEFDSGIDYTELQNRGELSSEDEEDDILDQIAGGKANVVEMKAQKETEENKKEKSVGKVEKKSSSKQSKATRGINQKKDTDIQFSTKKVVEESEESSSSSSEDEMAEKITSPCKKKIMTNLPTSKESNDKSDSITSSEESADEMDSEPQKSTSKVSSSSSEESTSSSDEDDCEENVNSSANSSSQKQVSEKLEESSSSDEDSSEENSKDIKTSKNTFVKPMNSKTEKKEIVEKEPESSSSSDEESSSEESDTSVKQNEAKYKSSSSSSSSESSDESSDDSSEKGSVVLKKTDTQNEIIKSEAKNKGKDIPKSKVLTPKEKEKKQKQDNKKRLESLKQRQEDAKSQQSLIKKALSAVDDNAKSNNKKIVFDSESDSSSESENEVIPDTKKNKLKNIEKAEKASKEHKPSLFDSSDDEEEDSDEEEKDKEMFQIRPEFEGKAGKKLMSMQGRFGNDQRFKMDQRFLEENSSDEEEEMETEAIEDLSTETSERDKAMQILSSVVGTKKMSVAAQKEAKQFKDISTLRYDPTNQEGEKFEIKNPEEGKKKKKKKKKEDNEVEEMEVVPEVSKERYFEVNEPLKGAFEKKENESFSFLSMFGRGDEEEKNKKGNEDLKTEVLENKKGFSWQEQFSDESSEDDEEESLMAKGKESQSKENTKTNVGKETFFFLEKDARIEEGINFFHRTEDIDKIREGWLEKRPSLIEAYKNKRKRVLRRLKHQKGGKHMIGLKRGKPVRGR